MESSLQHRGCQAWTGPVVRLSFQRVCRGQRGMVHLGVQRRYSLSSLVQHMIAFPSNSSASRASTEDSEHANLARQPLDLAGRGTAISDLFGKFRELVEAPCSSNHAVVKAGNEVLKQVKREVANLEGADQQLLFEILRLVKLLEVDLALLGAAQKEDTSALRLRNAKLHVLQASELISLL